MNILHWMRKENSGLARSTLELCEEEERQGHAICIRQPSEDSPIYGNMNGEVDIHVVHSQLGVGTYADNKPKCMLMHGEPLSSVGNGISMKAIVDLSPKIDAFICMRKEEQIIWQSIKRTFLIRKGLDLDKYKPLDGVTERLAGEPAVLYCENWRGQRNPLYVCIAMQEVLKRYPKAGLHLYNCNSQKMLDTFNALIKHNKWWTFIRTVKGAVDDVNLLYNRADIVVSGLYPLYARGIEAFGAGRAYIGAGYREHEDYPYGCDLQPESMAAAICKCWEEWGTMDFRQWAKDHHDIKDSVREAVKVYERYV